MKVQEYQRTERLRPLNAPTRNFVQDKRGEILGEALRQVGNDMHSVAMDKLDEANTTKFIDFKTKMDQYAIETRKSFLERKGGKAVNCTPEYLEALDKQKDTLMEGLNHKQSQMAMQWYGAYRNGQEDTMLSHESTEVGKYHLSVATENHEQAMARAVNALMNNNREEARNAMADVKNATAWVCRLTGESLSDKDAQTDSVVNLMYVKGMLKRGPAAKETQTGLVNRMTAFVNQAKKDGRMTEKDALTALNDIDPYRTRAEVVEASMAAYEATIKAEAQANADKNNVPVTMKYEIGYKNIRERIKDPEKQELAIQAFNKLYKVKDDAESEKLANAINQVKSEYQNGAGKPLGEIPMYNSLPAWVKNNTDFNRKYDDTKTVVGWLINPETLTVKAVQDAANLLTLDGSKSWIKTAQAAEQARASGNTAYLDKVIGYKPDTTIMNAIIRALPNSGKYKDTTGENWAKAYLMVRNLGMKYMAEHKTSIVPPDVFQTHVKMATARSNSSSWYGTDSLGSDLGTEAWTQIMTGDGSITRHGAIELSNYKGGRISNEPIFHSLVLNSLAKDPSGQEKVSASQLNAAFEADKYLTGPDGKPVSNSTQIVRIVIAKMQGQDVNPNTVEGQRKVFVAIGNLLKDPKAFNAMQELLKQ